MKCFALLSLLFTWSAHAYDFSPQELHDKAAKCLNDFLTSYKMTEHNRFCALSTVCLNTDAKDCSFPRGLGGCKPLGQMRTVNCTNWIAPGASEEKFGPTSGDGYIQDQLRPIVAEMQKEQDHLAFFDGKYDGQKRLVPPRCAAALAISGEAANLNQLAASKLSNGITTDYLKRRQAAEAVNYEPQANSPCDIELQAYEALQAATNTIVQTVNTEILCLNEVATMIRNGDDSCYLPPAANDLKPHNDILSHTTPSRSSSLSR